MPSRKNTRDLNNNVINPNDHFVLPNNHILPRSDARQLLANLPPSTWRTNDPSTKRIQQLSGELLSFLGTPPPGHPTFAKDATNLKRVPFEPRFVTRQKQSREDKRTALVDEQRSNRREKFMTNRQMQYGTKRKNGSTHNVATIAPFLRGNIVPNRPDYTTPDPFGGREARASSPLSWRTGREAAP